VSPPALPKGNSPLRYRLILWTGSIRPPVTVSMRSVVISENSSRRKITSVQCKHDHCKSPRYESPQISNLPFRLVVVGSAVRLTRYTKTVTTHERPGPYRTNGTLRPYPPTTTYTYVRPYRTGPRTGPDLTTTLTLPQRTNQPNRRNLTDLPHPYPNVKRRKT